MYELRNSDWKSKRNDSLKTHYRIHNINEND